ncbi:MAG: hypothetical protein J6X42_02635 [Alphaproteobacteria bacterium]|nr:hypothetical protein [Alphaproteobacteria bacterium]
MEKLGCLLGGCLTFLSFFFFGIILSTLIGALSGLIVGWFFSDTILGILASIGITGFKMWQI